MVASEITPKEDIDVCIAGCIKSVRAGGGSGDIFTNRDLFVMHCDNLRYIVLQICITPDPGESLFWTVLIKQASPFWFLLYLVLRRRRNSFWKYFVLVSQNCLCEVKFYLTLLLVLKRSEVTS